MKIAILTNDKYLYKAAELSLFGKATVTKEIDADTDTVLYDTESGLPLGAPRQRVIRLSRSGEAGTVALPLPFGFFDSLVLGGGEARLTLPEGGKFCLLDGKRIALTSHEYKLLSLLYSRSGDFVSREEISEGVWGGANDSLINIYIHYLREKLEGNDEKIIISSRKFGYGINKAFLGGKTC
ncbi:MAG: winged helix-turn-helix transcriptional regulator [Clostridia bacterium]|nr:winged helix-turn-helix transcriptional regulator [Clostridia bacterium]